MYSVLKAVQNVNVLEVVLVLCVLMKKNSVQYVLKCLNRHQIMVQGYYIYCLIYLLMRIAYTYLDFFLMSVDLGTVFAERRNCEIGI